jgi:hypothetical protein
MSGATRIADKSRLQVNATVLMVLTACWWFDTAS